METSAGTPPPLWIYFFGPCVPPSPHNQHALDVTDERLSSPPTAYARPLSPDPVRSPPSDDRPECTRNAGLPGLCRLRIRRQSCPHPLHSRSEEHTSELQ